MKSCEHRSDCRLSWRWRNTERKKACSQGFDRRNRPEIQDLKEMCIVGSERFPSRDSEFAGNQSTSIEERELREAKRSCGSSEAKVLAILACSWRAI